MSCAERLDRPPFSKTSSWEVGGGGIRWGSFPPTPALSAAREREKMEKLPYNSSCLIFPDDTKCTASAVWWFRSWRSCEKLQTFSRTVRKIALENIEQDECVMVIIYVLILLPDFFCNNETSFWTFKIWSKNLVLQTSFHKETSFARYTFWKVESVSIWGSHVRRRTHH